MNGNNMVSSQIMNNMFYQNQIYQNMIYNSYFNQIFLNQCNYPYQCQQNIFFQNYPNYNYKQNEIISNMKKDKNCFNKKEKEEEKED